MRDSKKEGGGFDGNQLALADLDEGWQRLARWCGGRE